MNIKELHIEKTIYYIGKIFMCEIAESIIDLRAIDLIIMHMLQTRVSFE